MDLADRMKCNYELPSRHQLLRRTPVIVRVDGKAFHSYCRYMAKPFSNMFMFTMDHTVLYCSKKMQGFKAAYVQSDEASFLLTDYDTLQTQPWMGYVQSKLESITASMFSVAFNEYVEREPYPPSPAFFDARAFNVPREEVSNYFLWRAKDWERNSLSMYCRSFFSDKQMHGKSSAEQHEMLHSIGKNWARDCNSRQRNGCWIFTGGFSTDSIIANYSDIDRFMSPLVNCDTP